MSQKILVIQDFDWADEMDVRAFQVMDKEELEDHFRTVEFGNAELGIEPVNFPRDCYFGTNEFEEVVSMENYKSYFDVKEITEEDCEVLKRLFGRARFGYLPLWIEN